MLYLLALPHAILVVTCIGLGRLYRRSYRDAAVKPATAVEAATPAE